MAQTTERKDRNKRPITSTQITFAAIVAIGLMLAVNFSGRITADRDLRQIQDTVSREIEFLEREQELLMERLRYVESDTFVENWAHSEGRMVRPGEVLIIPVPSTVNAAPPPVIQEPIEMETSRPEPSSWQLWWSLFFDSPPPQFNP